MIKSQMPNNTKFKQEIKMFPSYRYHLRQGKPRQQLQNDCMETQNAKSIQADPHSHTVFISKSKKIGKCSSSEYAYCSRKKEEAWRVASEHPGEARVTKLRYNNKARMYTKTKAQDLDGPMPCFYWKHWKPDEVVHSCVPSFPEAKAEECREFKAGQS